MKFLSNVVVVVATKAVLIFLCATITIEKASCSPIDLTAEQLLQQYSVPSLSSSSTNHVNRNSTTAKVEPLQSAGLEETVVQKNSTATNAKTTRTCACEDSEAPICASNGVTYKNTCRFDCAKARVTRLRQVKEGRCSQATGAQSYWQSKTG